MQYQRIRDIERSEIDTSPYKSRFRMNSVPPTTTRARDAVE
jgi:hypothetical protein